MNGEKKLHDTQNIVEHSWPFEAKVYTKDDEGNSILVTETIHIPRLTTRMMIRYRRALLARLKERGFDTEEAAEKAIEEVRFSWDEVGEMVIDILVPGLIDRLLPSSFNLLSDRLFAIESETLMGKVERTQNPEVKKEAEVNTPETQIPSSAT